MRKITIWENTSDEALIPDFGWEGANRKASIITYLDMLTDRVHSEFSEYEIIINQIKKGNRQVAVQNTDQPADEETVMMRVRELCLNVWADESWFTYTDPRRQEYWYSEGRRFSKYDTVDLAWIKALLTEKLQAGWDELEPIEKHHASESFRFGYEDEQ